MNFDLGIVITAIEDLTYELETSVESVVNALRDAGLISEEEAGELLDSYYDVG